MAGLALAAKHGFTYWRAINTIWQGWLYVHEGRVDEGITFIRQGLESCRASGCEITRPYELGKLALMYARCEQVKEGLRLLEVGLALAEHTEERWYEAELHRLQGKLLLALQPEGMVEAETCFRRALSIAHRQHAKAWELRAAASLARLWRLQGKRQEAYELLAPVYEWFGEGFDTADLTGARRLLDDLV